jgi:hypothetical protein
VSHWQEGVLGLLRAAGWWAAGGGRLAGGGGDVHFLLLLPAFRKSASFYHTTRDRPAEKPAELHVGRGASGLTKWEMRLVVRTRGKEGRGCCGAPALLSAVHGSICQMDDTSPRRGIELGSRELKS